MQWLKNRSTTIVFNDFEGGFYGIIVDNGFEPFNKLDPINLPPEFMEDGLRVRFKAKLRPDLYSFHMWGIMVKIINIEISYFLLEFSMKIMQPYSADQSRLLF